MQLPLEGITAKLDGAGERLGELEKVVNRRAVTDLLTIRKSRNPEGHVVVAVKEVAQIPLEWHVWIGECVHDMRSALEHLAYGLNVVGSSDPPPNETKSQFPIFRSSKKFGAMDGKPRRERMIGYFPVDARALVERLQPYHAGEDSDFADTAQWLGVLAELSNIDKHRRFPLTAVYCGLLTRPNVVEGHRVTASIDGSRQPLKAGAELFRLVVPSLPLNIEEPKVDFNYSAELHFEGEKSQPPLPLLSESEQVPFVLGSILQKIRDTILPAFQPFLE